MIHDQIERLIHPDSQFPTIKPNPIQAEGFGVALGNCDAMDRIGHIYVEGRVVPRDDAQAIKWFRKAAALGQADAQNELRRRGLNW